MTSELSSAGKRDELILHVEEAEFPTCIAGEVSPSEKAMRVI